MSMFGQVSKLSMIFAWAVVSKQVLELLSSTARVSNMWYLVGPHQSEASHDLVSSRYLEGGAQTATEHASRPPGIDPRASNTGAARERRGSVLLDMRRAKALSQWARRSRWGHQSISVHYCPTHSPLSSPTCSSTRTTKAPES